MEVLGKIFGKKKEDVVSSSELASLPREIFIQIFKKLDFGSLATAALVNRQWRDVGEDPRVWSNFPLICTEEMTKNLKEILAIRRFSFLRSITLTSKFASREDIQSFKRFFVTDDHLETILDHGSIVNMEIDTMDMDPVTIPIIRRMTRELSVLRLFSIGIWSKLVDTILTELNVASQDNNKCLQELGLINHFWRGQETITTVNSEIFGQSLTIVKRLILGNLRLSESQITNLFSNMKKEGSKIENLVIDNQDMQNIDPSLFCSALGCLKSLELISKNKSTLMVTPLQMELLMKEISLRMRMTHLRLTRIQIESVAPEVFAKATQNLEHFRLEAGDNTTEQMTAFLSNVALFEHPKLNNLFLNSCNMKGVPAELIGKQLSKVKILILLVISPEQVSALLREIVEGSVVEELIINSSGGMNEVDANLMAEALNKLRKVGLYNTGLEGEHINAILNRSLQGTNLRSIDFRECCDGEVLFEKAVSRELVEKAKVLIPEIFHPQPKERKSLLNPVNLYRAVAEMLEDSD